MEAGLELGTVAGLALLVSGGTYLAWPDSSREASLALAQPAAAAVERLQAEQRVVEGTGMGSLTIASAGKDGEALLIGVTRAGDTRTVTCRVAITPASPAASNAEVDCAQDQVKDGPIRNVAVRALDLVVIEHVAATVDDRAYDIDGVSNRLLALVAMNPAAVAAAMPSPRD